MPLPETGRPDDFSGNVGNFSLDLKFDRSLLKTFDERRISVTVSGEGNFLSMAAPELTVPQGVKVIRGDGQFSFKVEKQTVRGSKEFVFTVIPEKPDNRACHRLR